MLLSVINFIFQNIFLVSYVSGSNSFPPPLTAEEEEECLKRYADGDDDAKNKLIEHNLRLVAHVVKKYHGCGIDNDDLISIGTIGLIKAIATYDSEKKIRIATYAARCIENEVLMVLRSNKKTQSEISLQGPLGFDKEGNEVSLLDILRYEPDDITEKIELKNQVKNLYKTMGEVLKGREKIVLKYRYGLCGHIAKTQREIAKALGISRSYVSRIEKKAIKKLAGCLDK